MKNEDEELKFVLALIGLIGGIVLLVAYPRHIKSEQEYREKELIKLFGSGKTVVCGGGYAGSYLVSKERGWSLDLKQEHFIKGDYMKDIKICEEGR
ncbi:MAG: hypothetical protein PHX13_10365 [Thiovulaceae bacterium]|nr:hypothetical protein [Sulfurimonadaceae bacterium]